jgi:hypothetical protein
MRTDNGSGTDTKLTDSTGEKMAKIDGAGKGKLDDTVKVEENGRKSPAPPAENATKPASPVKSPITTGVEAPMETETPPAETPVKEKESIPASTMSSSVSVASPETTKAAA